ncbi:MAG: epoxyqueuosine reductase [Defluviitaleaceae bacterium]|nr:epoxyqueuosine reductase [Defluviitaleaceae bacterium]
MTINDIIKITEDFAEAKIFNLPIFAIGDPADEYFQACKQPHVIGSHFQAPLEWLPPARSVISFFLPYTQKIRAANAQDFAWPAEEWLHGRYEGQNYLKSLTLHLQNAIQKAGYATIAPAFHENYKTTNNSSNWSERHIAFGCGLGTFGISKGIITAKGTCGRLSSLVTELPLPPTPRPYTDIYEYCTKCAACLPHCPASAISLNAEKDDGLCAAFLNKVMEKSRPRYGCGKCQVSVPCEDRNPTTLRG